MLCYFRAPDSEPTLEVVVTISRQMKGSWLEERFNFVYGMASVLDTDASHIPLTCLALRPHVLVGVVTEPYRDNATTTTTTTTPTTAFVSANQVRGWPCRGEASDDPCSRLPTPSPFTSSGLPLMTQRDKLVNLDLERRFNYRLHAVSTHLRHCHIFTLS
ncbi:unnamed protein product [Hydatigera taeniaeformis]|uniref:Uncharacterized protein n=1 Tax=Hydatigena taeniaeformis TaxID=6205 RepID=A0A0R3XD40_HYDTA|nr:unnamed protein product [Hydatigera taeniaeformis]